MASREWSTNSDPMSGRRHSRTCGREEDQCLQCAYSVFRFRVARGLQVSARSIDSAFVRASHDQRTGAQEFRRRTEIRRAGLPGRPAGAAGSDRETNMAISDWFVSWSDSGRARRVAAPAECSRYVTPYLLSSCGPLPPSSVAACYTNLKSAIAQDLVLPCAARNSKDLRCVRSGGSAPYS